MAVVELLRIDAKQFKQIAMIAQGDFYNLLNAKTENRTEILRKIFRTDGYKKIELILKNKLDSLSRKKTEIESSMVQYFDDVTAEEGSKLCEELHILKQTAGKSGEMWNLAEYLELLNRVIEEEEETLERQKEKLLREEEILEEKKRILATKELADSERDLEQAKQVVMQAKLLAEDRSKLQPEAETFKRQADKIGEEEENYKQRDRLTEKLEGLRKTERQLAVKKMQLADRTEQLKEKISLLQQTAEELENKPKELQSLESLIEKLEMQKEEADQIVEKRISALRETEWRLAEKQEIYEKKRRKYEKAYEIRQRNERILEQCRAGILAQGLREGEMCPVCGSIHHPQRASLPEEFISEDELKRMQEEEEKARKEKEQAVVAAEREKTAFDVEEKRLKGDMLNYLKGECFAALGFDLEEETYSELCRKMREAQSDVGRQISEKRQERDRLEDECRRLETARRKLNDARGKERDELEKETKAYTEQNQSNSAH